MTKEWTTPDPLAGADSVPSLSWKDAPFGASYTGVVTRLPEPAHSRDFETGEKAYWDDAKQEPKMAVVLHIRLAGGGDDQERAIWAMKPSSMYQALADAQKASQRRIDLGDTLTVTFTGEKPNSTNPRLNPAKQYTVVHTPADPLADDTPASTSNGWSAPPAAAASSSSASPAAAVPAAAAPTDPAQAMALLTQVKGLISFGLTDEQIRATIPQVTVEALAAVRAIPVG